MVWEIAAGIIIAAVPLALVAFGATGALEIINGAKRGEGLGIALGMVGAGLILTAGILAMALL